MHSGKTAKQKHREQLVVLLVNKFRNKHKTTTDPRSLEIDNLITLEVKNLLKEGSATDASLTKLDAKLETAIAEIKAKTSKKDETSEVKLSEIKSNKLCSEAITPSIRSHAASASTTGRKVYHIDPAEKLVPNEDQWFKTVMEQL